MKKLIIVILLTIYLEIVSSLPIIENDLSNSPAQSYSRPRRNSSFARQSTMSRQGSKLRYQQNANVKKPTTTFNINKPANIPTKNGTKSKSARTNKSYSNPSSENFRGSLFFNSSGQLMNVGNPSQPEQPINANVAPGIPIQQPEKTVTIEGKNGKIYVNKEMKYSKDETFKDDREVHIRIQDGNFYVNDNLVLKKGRSDHDRVIQSTNNLDYNGITNFVWKIHSDGNMEYKDNKGGNLRINYYTPIEVMSSFLKWLH